MLTGFRFARDFLVCQTLIWGFSGGIGATELSCPPLSPAAAAEVLGIDVEREKAAKVTAGGDPPPNVIIILADDLRYDVASTDGGDVPTPNLDRLARAGARFVNGYSSAALCSPARAALLTGKQPMAIPHGHNMYNQHRYGLSLKEKTLANYFFERGYSTGMIGKWHLGVGKGYRPDDRGFEEFLLGVRPEKKKTKISGKFNNNFLHGFSKPESCESVDYFLSDMIAVAATDFILRHRNVPFFLYLPLRAVHKPWVFRPESFFKRLSYYLIPAFIKRNSQERAHFKSLVYLDETVGQVLDTIDFLSLSKNTLIWFLSDNGFRDLAGRDLAGERRRAKGSFYEAGIRVPFIVRWTGTILPGVYEWPVQSLDILPTSLAAAGAINPLSEKESHYVTGRNILPYLRHPSDPPDRYLYWKQRYQRPEHPHSISPTTSAVRFGNWKLIQKKFNGETISSELYNLQNDAEESMNLLGANESIRANSDIFSDLSGRLDALTEFVPD